MNGSTPRESVLANRAASAAIEADWLVKVEVFLVGNDEANEEGQTRSKVISLLQPPDIQVSEVRRIIRDAIEVPEKEQRLTLAGSCKHVLHGPLPPPDPEGVVSIQLRRVVLDPRLDALFGMVRMESVDERCELMSLMTKPRRAGGCYCDGDRSLTELLDDDDDLKSFECAKCFFRKTPGRTVTRGGTAQELLVCRECDFAICTFCRPDDGGWVPPADPYRALADMAVDLGGRMARIGGWFGGRGHFCGHPRVECRDGIAPRAYRGQCEEEGAAREGRRRCGEAGVVVNREKQVLHDGIRLRVVLSEKVRDILIDEDLDFSCLEWDRVLPDGATIQDMISYRNMTRESEGSKLWPELWSVAARELENQFSHYRTREGDQARAYRTSTMLSFGIEEAVFELGAYVDDGDY